MHSTKLLFIFLFYKIRAYLQFIFSLDYSNNFLRLKFFQVTNLFEILFNKMLELLDIASLTL